MIVNRQVQELERKNIDTLKNFCPLLHSLSKEFVSKLPMIQICGNFGFLVFLLHFKNNVIYSFIFSTGETHLDAALLMTTDLMTYGFR